MSNAGTLFLEHHPCPSVDVTLLFVCVLDNPPVLSSAPVGERNHGHTTVMVAHAGLSGVFPKTTLKFPVEVRTTIRVCLPGTRVPGDARKGRYVFPVQVLLPSQSLMLQEGSHKDVFQIEGFCIVTFVKTPVHAACVQGL